MEDCEEIVLENENIEVIANFIDIILVKTKVTVLKNLVGVVTPADVLISYLVCIRREYPYWLGIIEPI